MNRPDGFYKDFKVFIAEVAKARQRADTLDLPFSAASVNVFGASAANNILPVGYAMKLFGGVLSGFAAGAVASTSSGIGWLATVGSLVGTKRKDVDREAERLQRARSAFEDLAEELEDGEDGAIEGIDRLFEAMVQGDDIVV